MYQTQVVHYNTHKRYYTDNKNAFYIIYIIIIIVILLHTPGVCPTCSETNRLCILVLPNTYKMCIIKSE